MSGKQQGDPTMPGVLLVGVNEDKPHGVVGHISVEFSVHEKGAECRLSQTQDWSEWRPSILDFAAGAYVLARTAFEQIGKKAQSAIVTADGPQALRMLGLAVTAIERVLVSGWLAAPKPKDENNG